MSERDPASHLLRTKTRSFGCHILQCHIPRLQKSVDPGFNTDVSNPTGATPFHAVGGGLLKAYKEAVGHVFYLDLQFGVQGIGLEACSDDKKLGRKAWMVGEGNRG
jgi:hypothetical protein